MKGYEKGSEFNLLNSDNKVTIQKKQGPFQRHKILKNKKIWLLTLTPLSLLILFFAQSNSWIAEYIFARGIYKWLSQVLSVLTGIIPISLMEIQVLVFPPLALFFIIRFLWRIIRGIIKKQNNLGNLIGNSLLNGACILSVILFLFVIFAGVNYHRYSFASYSGLSIQDSSVEELYHLSLDLAQKTSDLRTKLHLEGKENENGVIQLTSSSHYEMGKKTAEAFSKLAKKYSVLSGKYGNPKPVFFSRFMSRMGITGIYWPFTLEANVNVDTTEYSIPVTMAHELSHLRGFMREDEANFIAYLVCKESDDLTIQYSGYMLALTYASNQLYKENKELYNKVLDLYDPYMLADLREEYYYWVQFEDSVINTISNNMNDTYLKANKQADGVKSYGRMVDLLLAEYRMNR